MFIRPFCFFSLGLSSLLGEPLKVSPELFSTPEFKQRFVGSYGFLPAVEPKVDQEEAGVIAELSEILSLGRFKEAERHLLDFIQERKNPVESSGESKDVSAALIFTLGNLYYQNGRVADGEQAYKIAIKRFPEYRRAHKNLALLYARSDRLKEAMPHLMKAIDLGESDHLTFGLLGHAMLSEDKAMAAEAAFRQAYLLNPEEKDWKIGLAQALLAKEDWVQAASLMQTLIDESPEDATMWMQQANCFIQMDQVMRAAENYEILRLKGLADEAALNQLGDIYANQEQPLLALGAYLSAMKQSDVVKVGRSLKAAKYLLQLSANRESERLMLELRERAGDSMSKEEKITALLIESDIASADRNLDEASALLSQALELSPADGNARVKLGQILMERAEISESDAGVEALKADARTQFLLAADDRDDDVAYQANLKFAQLLVKDQQYLKALPKLEAAVRLKSGSKQSIEQYLRRVQRAADAEKARKEREELEREERLEAAEKAAEQAEAEKEGGK
ncbi:tetratricopeptide repeat protein [Verrucomicrobiaceae bacterium 227]